MDISEILTRGGEHRVALLRYCVMSITMEPVFVFLAHEYRLRPTHASALALYDVFCARDAVARIGPGDALPPRDLHLQAAAESIRAQWNQLQSPRPDEHPGIAITTPHKNLYDRLVDAVRNSDRFADLARRYVPERAPLQNLPDGRMNIVQKHFVEHVWRPVVRPRLCAAGFWQVASIE